MSNCDEIQNTDLARDEHCHIWIAFLCHHIYELQIVKNGPVLLAHPVFLSDK